LGGPANSSSSANISWYLWNTSGGSFGRFPDMHVRPGQCQDYSEHQRIGGDIQIKVGQAVHQNRRNTPDATQGNGFVETFFRFLELTGGLGEHPEDRPKHQNSARQAEFTSDLQVIAVAVLDEEMEENGLNGRINCPKRSPTRFREEDDGESAERNRAKSKCDFDR